MSKLLARVGSTYWLEYGVDTPLWSTAKNRSAGRREIDPKQVLLEQPPALRFLCIHGRDGLTFPSAEFRRALAAGQTLFMFELPGIRGSGNCYDRISHRSMSRSSSKIIARGQFLSLILHACSDRARDGCTTGKEREASTAACAIGPWNTQKPGPVAILSSRGRESSHRDFWNRHAPNRQVHVVLEHNNETRSA
jgi:hypothetical protein